MEQWEIELKKNQAERIINIEKSLNYSPLGHILNDIEKGKRMPIGTITNGFKKIAEGKWRKVSEHGKTKEEHESRSNFNLRSFKDLQSTQAEDKNRRDDEMDEHYKDYNNHKQIASKLDSKDYSDDEVISGEKEIKMNLSFRNKSFIFKRTGSGTHDWHIEYDGIKVYSGMFPIKSNPLSKEYKDKLNSRILSDKSYFLSIAKKISIKKEFQRMNFKHLDDSYMKIENMKLIPRWVRHPEDYQMKDKYEKISEYEKWADIFVDINEDKLK